MAVKLSKVEKSLYKQCPCCLEVKARTLFSPRPAAGPEAIRTYCKECDSKRRWVPLEEKQKYRLSLSDMVDTKTCKSCLITKDRSEFYNRPNKLGLSYLMPYCKVCHNNQVRVNRLKRKGKLVTEPESKPNRITKTGKIICFKCDKQFWSESALEGPYVFPTMQRQCPECKAGYHQAYREKNREVIREKQRLLKADPEKYAILKAKKSLTRAERLSTPEGRSSIAAIYKRSSTKARETVSDGYMKSVIKHTYGKDVIIPPEYIEMRRQVLLLKRGIGLLDPMSRASTKEQPGYLGLKMCNECKELSPRANFQLKCNPNHLASYCYTCRIAKGKEYRLQSKEKLNEIRRKSKSKTA
jgi:hypothetical protein